jgi:xylan 1,4-beta-xylosidase
MPAMPARSLARTALLVWAGLFAFWAGAEEPAVLATDFSKLSGEIRPLHGGNCGPLQYGEITDLTAYHRELGIPYTRLHDCHWPNPDVVDIHAVFPDAGADPARPESYDFRRTDDYLQAVINAGSRIVYRLGESIEHSRRKYHVHPPKDAEKWAAICQGIIRHYNEGWAGGFRHGIVYWEIWNEPENRPAMWTGGDEDYFRLYEAAAKAVKSRWPDLKVGGPSLGYTGRVKEGRFEPGEFLLRFLERCKERALPLDFFSWHLYTDDPSECRVRAKGIRETLDRLGFARTEVHFNEWNYLPGNDWTPMTAGGRFEARERFYDRIGGAPGAAFAACVLVNLQDAPVNVANYYMSDNQGFGLFTFHGVPRKNFHAMKAFRRLLDTPLRAEAAGALPDRLVLCAGLDRGNTEAGILVVNYRFEGRPVHLDVRGLPWSGPTTFELSVVDARRNLETVRSGTLPAEGLDLSAELKAPAVGLLKLRPGGNR